MTSESSQGGHLGHSQFTCLQMGAWNDPRRQGFHLAMVSWALLLLPPLSGLAALSCSSWLAILQQPHQLMVFVAQHSG